MRIRRFARFRAAAGFVRLGRATCFIAMLFGLDGIVTAQSHETADHLIPLLLQYGRSDGAVNTAAHGDKHFLIVRSGLRHEPYSTRLGRPGQLAGARAPMSSCMFIGWATAKVGKGQVAQWPSDHVDLSYAHCQFQASSSLGRYCPLVYNDLTVRSVGQASTGDWLPTRWQRTRRCNGTRTFIRPDAARGFCAAAVDGSGLRAGP